LSFYQNQILPRLLHLACNSKEFRKRRQEALGAAQGVVLEVGFGSGLSVPYYTGPVSKLLAVEPSMTARKLAAKAISKSRFPVEFAGLDGERVDLPDASADMAVSFLTLCTIPRPERALAEIMRILKPGGRLIFVEHGASPDAGVLKWQNRLNGFQGKVCGGCNLNRRIEGLVRESGLKIESLRNEYVKGPPRPVGYLYVGTARKA
jgi:ubiquinone/menaquinone biosynthesis C-methylase UbiE